MRPSNQVKSSAVPGVIDTLSHGFEQINRILWVIALPIVVDLFLWLAPRVTATPVVAQISHWYGQLTQAYAASAGTSTLDQTQQAINTFEQAATHFNLLSLFVVNVAGVPSTLPTSLAGRPIWQISSVGALVGAVVAAELIGSLIGCLYLAVIGQQIRDGRITAGKLGRQVGFFWLSVIGCMLLFVGLTLAVSLPLGLAIGLVQLVAPGVGVALWLAAVAAIQIIAILLVVYLFFLVDAIVVSQAGPIRAAMSSARVVANNFWSSVGFIVLIYVISLGTQVIWTGLSQSPAGTLVAIAGNAYIASGLTAASMLFYQARVAKLPAARGVIGRVTQT
ncbi:MAG TPA: hypothetical protein VNG11_05860 [Chloroflexota bacterium]|nr:hypothetical protein [Chloroflexota bacterium]